MKTGLLKAGDGVIAMAYLEDPIEKIAVDLGDRGTVVEVDTDLRWVRVAYPNRKNTWVHPMNLRRLSPLELLAECAE